MHKTKTLERATSFYKHLWMFFIQVTKVSLYDTPINICCFLQQKTVLLLPSKAIMSLFGPLFWLCLIKFFFLPSGKSNKRTNIFFLLFPWKVLLPWMHHTEGELQLLTNNEQAFTPVPKRENFYLGKNSNFTIF